MSQCRLSKNLAGLRHSPRCPSCPAVNSLGFRYQLAPPIKETRSKRLSKHRKVNNLEPLTSTTTTLPLPPQTPLSWPFNCQGHDSAILTHRSLILASLATLWSRPNLRSLSRPPIDPFLSSNVAHEKYQNLQIDEPRIIEAKWRTTRR
jgi:hypothetical protein